MPRNHSSIFSYLFLLILILSFSSIFAKVETEIKKLPSKKFTTQEEISKYLKTTDLTILVFYYKTGSEKSNAVAENLKIVYSKLQYLIEFISIDCDKSSMEGCRQNDDDMEDEFYRIEMFVPPQYKYNPYTKELNKHQKLQYAKSDISDKALYKFLTKINNTFKK